MPNESEIYLGLLHIMSQTAAPLLMTWHLQANTPELNMRFGGPVATHHTDLFAFYIVIFSCSTSQDCASATDVLFVTTTKTVYVFGTDEVVVQLCDKNFKPLPGAIIQTNCFGRDPDAVSE